MKVIKCPNCGASSTNHTNCEYCGSLLVRFVDKGIDLSTTNYMTNEKVYAGLIEALKKNLERQELNPGKLVTTDICYKSSSTVKLSRKRHGVVVVGRTGSAYWNDGDNIKLSESNMGLVIKFSFDVIADGEDTSGVRIQNQFEKFQKLSSLQLFTYHTGIYMRSGSSNRFRCREYAIDFGQDYEGAARLISEVLDKVYEIPYDGKLTFLAEDDNVKPIEIREETNEVNKSVRDFTKLESIGLWTAGIWASFMLLMTLVEGLWISLFICIAVLVPLYYLIEDKLDKKYTWLIVIGIISISFCAVGSQLEKKPQTKVKTEHKASENKETNAEKNSQQQKKSRKDEIRELGYNDGVEFGYSDRGEALRYYVQMGKTLDQGLDHIQNVIARTAYKEDYGDNISESLLDEYCKQFIEGYKSIVIKK